MLWGGSSHSPACTWPLVLPAARLVPGHGSWGSGLDGPGSLPHPIPSVGRGPPYLHQPLPILGDAEHGMPTGTGSAGSHRAGAPTALPRWDIDPQPRLFQLPGQRIRPRRHLPAEAMLPHPGGCPSRFGSHWLPGHRDGFRPQLSPRQSCTSTTAAGLNARWGWRGVGDSGPSRQTPRRAAGPSSAPGQPREGHGRSSSAEPGRGCCCRSDTASRS